MKPIRLQRKETFDRGILIAFHVDNYILLTIYIVNDTVVSQLLGPCRQLQIGFSNVDAFSVPRSELPRPADASSPSKVRFAPFRLRLTTRGAAEGLSPYGEGYSKLSVERFRTLPRYRGRPAAADMAFCISDLSSEMPEDAIMRALKNDYLSRDPNSSRKAA